MHRAIVAILLAGCGRIGFAVHGSASDDGGGDGTPPPGDTLPDAFATCAGGDGLCPLSCVATDPDCMTTCGDAVCVGNAGELCANCAADCQTTTPVCGNGACDPGEAPNCYADCGPNPWPWIGDENALVIAINNTRTTGVACPTKMFATAPALTADTAFGVAQRDYVWEIAHQNVFMPGGATCNGRTFAMRSAAGGFSGALASLNALDAAAAVASWKASSTLCPILMDTSFTTVGVAVAHDQSTGWEAVFK